jgi:hypothetical protein
VPLLASVETQPYPQANSSTGGILCDSRGQDHAIVITGYNQTGFMFNSATNEQSNPQFVSDDSLNTYAQEGRVVNGYGLYCPYSEFINAFSNESWSFTAIFPINYAPVMRQQTVHLVDENNQPISGMLVSSPLSTARTNSDGYATLTITDLGTPITLGYNIQTNAYGNFCGNYYDIRQVGYCSSVDYGIYMLYPTTANWQAPTNRQIQYL